ncbi:hypothetical protein SAMN05216227_100371 [Pseudorhodobacter antarcticus]|uniref:Uncharacterized protein n=1 Tax=Pseudorhodobacter antarcticus TaxID=1077947 RepID=A0A1H8BLF1_9RHOB|nr:hypothetical protein [Pseudorhodobacter antarcticus]SEM83710.1 hypothetical protein SAMN05216227_100371 [Pseudorhodobacter antarcticus]
MDRIISMIINQLIRRFVNGGINKGIGMLDRKGAAKPNAPKLNAADHAQSATATDTAKRARQAARLTKRFMR